MTIASLRSGPRYHIGSGAASISAGQRVEGGRQPPRLVPPVARSPPRYRSRRTPRPAPPRSRPARPARDRRATVIDRSDPDRADRAGKAAPRSLRGGDIGRQRRRIVRREPAIRARQVGQEPRRSGRAPASPPAARGISTRPSARTSIASAGAECAQSHPPRPPRRDRPRLAPRAQAHEQAPSPSPRPARTAPRPAARPSPVPSTIIADYRTVTPPRHRRCRHATDQWEAPITKKGHGDAAEPASDRSRRSATGPERRRSVAIMVRLERALDRHADVAGLLRRQLRQLHAELFEVQRRDLLVEVLGQDVDFVLVLARPWSTARSARASGW